MKLVWMTDIHLNFLESEELDTFCYKITSLNPDGVMIGGDIGEAPTIKNLLLKLEHKLRCPIYFVLGNHDYYYGSISGIRNQILEVTENSHWLKYLTINGIVGLTQNTCLLGHDSWADGRFGDYFSSEVMLNDYVLIKELSNIDKKTRLRKLNQLGDEAAQFFREQLNRSFLNYQNILIITHVPPFIEASWHEGNLSNSQYLPHFCCKATGQVLIELMQKHPNHHLTVLCGHTHGSGMCYILPNLFVKTGGAIYGKPTFQDAIILNE